MKPRSAVRKLSRALDLFRAMDPELPTQVIEVFCTIAQHDEVQTRDLPDMTGLTQSSVNRAVTYLADHHWRDRSKTGLKLIAQRTDPMDRRQRVVSLTPKGVKLSRQLEEIFNG